jgi:hypothetical protein
LSFRGDPGCGCSCLSWNPVRFGPLWRCSER